MTAVQLLCEESEWTAILMMECRREVLLCLLGVTRARCAGEGGGGEGGGRGGGGEGEGVGGGSEGERSGGEED